MSTYVQVPLEALHEVLTSQKFDKSKVGREVVYVRAHSTNPHLLLQVYSSVAEGSESARKVGQDAIRVALAVKDPKGGQGVGLFSKRVYRVTSVASVLDRIRSACLEAAEEAQRYAKVCPYCGAPAYTDSGRCVIKVCRETKRTARIVEIRGKTYPHRSELGKRGFEWRGNELAWVGNALPTDADFLKMLESQGCTVKDVPSTSPAT